MESKLSELISRLKSETKRINMRDEQHYTIAATDDELRKIKDKLYHNGQEIVFQNPEEFKKFINIVRIDVIRPFNNRKSLI